MMFQCDKCGAIVDPAKGKPHRYDCPLVEAMTPTPPPLTADEIAALRKLHEEDVSAGAAFDADEALTANQHRLLATTEALRNALHNAAPQLLAACERAAELEAECKTAADAFEAVCEACDGAVNRTAALDWIERAKRWRGQVAALQAEGARLLAEKRAAEEKLRAAEAVVEAARHFAACDNAKGWVLCWDATRQALSAFDAINPDGSTGGSGEGVG